MAQVDSRSYWVSNRIFITELLSRPVKSLGAHLSGGNAPWTVSHGDDATG
jgi:hypothetical protein